MEPSAADGWLGALAVVVVAAIGFLSTLVTSRAGRKAGREQESIEQGVISMESLLGVVKSYETRMRSLEAAVAKTNRDLDGMHEWKRAAIRYIRALRDHGARHVPGESLPEPPAELLHDLREDD